MVSFEVKACEREEEKEPDHDVDSVSSSVILDLPDPHALLQLGNVGVNDLDAHVHSFGALAVLGEHGHAAGRILAERVQEVGGVGRGEREVVGGVDRVEGCAGPGRVRVVVRVLRAVRGEGVEAGH